jgi:hypothetical protein
VRLGRQRAPVFVSRTETDSMLFRALDVTTSDTASAAQDYASPSEEGETGKLTKNGAALRSGPFLIHSATTGSQSGIRSNWCYNPEAQSLVAQTSANKEAAWFLHRVLLSSPPILSLTRGKSQMVNTFNFAT